MRARPAWFRVVLQASPIGSITASILLIVLIGLIDYLTGYRFRVSIFYLLPVFWTTWRAGKAAGLAVSLLAAAIWLLADVAARGPGTLALLPLWNALVTLGFLAVTVLVLSAFREEHSLARTCSLTGLPNRLAFFEAAEAEIERFRRYPRPLSVLYVDLDGFKSLNDRFGHRAGDAALKAVGDVLKAHVRSVDVAARLGGDEFAVLLPETGLEAAEAVAGKLKDRLERAAPDRPWKVVSSVGIATFLRPPESVDELIRTADEEMYAAKRAGKNAVRKKLIGPVQPETSTGGAPGPGA
jgi:diguanylate cyclase (GGDEF)-like protein